MADGSTPQGYKEVIEWVDNPANQEEVNKIEKLAQETVKDFSYPNYLKIMASIIEETVAEVKGKNN
jgi:hypothetical protein